jgi:hypothetical protein
MTAKSVRMHWQISSSEAPNACLSHSRASKTRIGTGRRPRGDFFGHRVAKLCSMARTRAAQGNVSAHWRMGCMTGTKSATCTQAPVPLNQCWRERTKRMGGSPMERGNESRRIRRDHQLHTPKEHGKKLVITIYLHTTTQSHNTRQDEFIADHNVQNHVLLSSWRQKQHCAVQFTSNLRNFNGVETAEIFNQTEWLLEPHLRPTHPVTKRVRTSANHGNLRVGHLVYLIKFHKEQVEHRRIIFSQLSDSLYLLLSQVGTSQLYCWLYFLARLQRHFLCKLSCRRHLLREQLVFGTQYRYVEYSIQ